MRLVSRNPGIAAQRHRVELPYVLLGCTRVERCAHSAAVLLRLTSTRENSHHYRVGAEPVIIEQWLQKRNPMLHTTVLKCEALLKCKLSCEILLIHFLYLLKIKSPLG